jgi:signal peptidase I
MSDGLTVQLARDLLSSGRTVRMRAQGWSMRPFLRDGDVVEIAPAPASALKRGDVAAFITPESNLPSITIHRFLRRDGAGQLHFQGDAFSTPDPPVPESALLGKVVARERNGRRTEIGKGWRNHAGTFILLTGSIVRSAMRFHGGVLRLYRGGASLPIPGGLDAARDRLAIGLALGHGMNYETARALFGEKPTETLLEVPEYHPLLPSIAWRRREQGMRQANGMERVDAMDATAEGRLRAEEESALFRSAQCEAMLRFLAATLHEAGLELLVVKGAAMAFDGVYPAPHLRLGTDVDTICSPETVRRVVKLLLDAGFANAEPEYPLSYYLTYRNEVALYRKGYRWPILEIHWGPAGPLYYSRRLPVTRLWSASRQGPWGTGLRVLSPEMEMAHSLVHLTKHMRHLRPIWALDFALLTRQGLDWRRVTAEIARAGLEWPAWFIFRWLEKRVPGTIPAALLERVALRRRRAPWNWIEMRVLHRMCDGQGRWLEVMHLPTWRQRLGYLREVAAPSRPVMERLYPEAKEHWIVPFHLRRWRRLLGKLIPQSDERSKRTSHHKDTKEQRNNQEEI